MCFVMTMICSGFLLINSDLIAKKMVEEAKLLFFHMKFHQRDPFRNLNLTFGIFMRGEYEITLL